MAAVDLCEALENLHDSLGSPHGGFSLIEFNLGALLLWCSYSEGPEEVGDDGGEVIDLDGTWGVGEHVVTVDDIECYSGRQGEGLRPIPNEGRVRFVVPPNLSLGSHDVVVTWDDGNESITLPDFLTVLRRHRRMTTLDLARLLPGEAFDRGPTRPTQGVLLTSAAVDPVPSHPLFAWVAAVGQLLNDVGGLIFTRLVEDMPPALLGTSPAAEATVATVETTYEFPAAGTILLNGEVIAYTGKTDTTLTGLDRDDAITDTYKAGDPVLLWTQDRSDIEIARRMLSVATAEGDYLDVLGRNIGVPRYLDADDDLYRRMIRALGYQAGRGSPTAIGELLDLLLDGRGIGADDGATDATGLTSATGGFTAGMVGMRVRLNGDIAQEYVIAEVTDANTVVFETQADSQHNGWPGTEATGVTWALVPWDVIEDPWEPGVAIVRIWGAPPEDPTGFAYLQGGEVVTPDDLETVTVSSTIRQVLGVWRVEDTRRLGTNYATDNNFAGNVITLSTPLPDVGGGGEFDPIVPPDVIVDYGSVAVPDDTDTSIPGAAWGTGTAQLMKDITWRNPGNQREIDDEAYANKSVPITRYPLYLGDRVGTIAAILEYEVIAGVRPRVEVVLW